MMATTSKFYQRESTPSAFLPSHALLLSLARLLSNLPDTSCGVNLCPSMVPRVFTVSTRSSQNSPSAPTSRNAFIAPTATGSLAGRTFEPREAAKNDIPSCRQPADAGLDAVLMQRYRSRQRKPWRMTTLTSSAVLSAFRSSWPSKRCSGPALIVTPSRRFVNKIAGNARCSQLLKDIPTAS